MFNKKDRIVRKWEDNDHWVFYVGNGEWSTAIERAYKFTLKDAQRFRDTVVGSRVSIIIFDN